MGNFSGERRFSQFHSLNNALIINWPGVYLPHIPPKKAVGNKDIEFVIERMYFLERFFMKISTMPFLRNCEELKIFARPDILGLDLDK